MNHYYALLGVLPNASPAEIKASYRQLAKRFHPDVAGGNSRFFARVREAYETLSEPRRRRAYDAQWRRPRGHARHATETAGKSDSTQSAGKPAPQGGAAAAKPADARPPLPLLTRIMSITVPRSGRFQLQGLIGNIHIEPTRPANLWETTLRKYGDADPESLARHVIQIKLSGERDLVRSMMPKPTDFGVEFQSATEREKKDKIRKFIQSLLGDGPLGGLFTSRPFGLYGTFLPLTLHVTVPEGTPLYLRDITGSIIVGDVESEVVAKLLGGAMRAGRISKAHLTLHGSSRAFIARTKGAIDLMGFGTSKTYIGGNVSRMRVVLDNGAQAEVGGTITNLLAEVNGNGLLEVRNTVYEAHCDVRDSGQVRLARVTARLDGTCSPGARVVLENPSQDMSIAG